MTSAAEHRKTRPSEADAILNALPNPVILIGPDGKIVDANNAAEAFFEISTQFLQRQQLKELVPFGSPLLALIDQVRSCKLAGQRIQGRSRHAAHGRRPPGRSACRAAAPSGPATSS